MTESWMQIISLFLANAALILWFRAESRSDWRHMDAQSKDFQQAILQEMKDFHGRLERQDAEFKGKIEKQDAEFKAHLLYEHSNKKTA
jgi:hypothetical protein